MPGKQGRTTLTDTLLYMDMGLPVGPTHNCPYLEGHDAAERAFLAENLSPAFYHALVRHGWRRSGRVVYKPACPSCSACIPIRVPVADFRPNRTQKKLWRRNTGFEVHITSARPREETFDLFVRYQQERHTGDMCTTWEEFTRFLYDSPVSTREFAFYRDGRLAIVGIVDVSASALSAVYTFFDPEIDSLSPGTWAILWFIDYARREGMDYYYMGYYIGACRKMNYKTQFRPYELGDDQGNWTRFE